MNSGHPRKYSIGAGIALAVLALVPAVTPAPGQAVLPANGISIWNSEPAPVIFGLSDDGEAWELFRLDPEENRTFPHYPLFGIRRGPEQIVYQLEPGQRYRIFFDTSIEAWDLRLRAIE